MITTPNDRLEALESLEGIATLDVPLIIARTNLRKKRNISNCGCESDHDWKCDCNPTCDCNPECRHCYCVGDCRCESDCTCDKDCGSDCTCDDYCRNNDYCSVDCQSPCWSDTY